MNLVLQTWPKCVQGGEGVKNPENFAYVLNGWPLTTHVIQIVFRLTRCQLSCMNVANDKNTKYFSELLNQNDEYDMETILEDAAETGRI